jgi:hypothetical protein
MDSTKRCPRCREAKPQEAFPPSKHALDGLYPWCRACKAAYAREKKAKTQEPDLSSIGPTVIAKFWSLVLKGSADECWPWQGSHKRGKKPFFSLDYQQWPARRIAYTLAHGPVSDDVYVAVTCGDGLCLNPAHLDAAPKASSLTTDGRKVCSRCREAKALDQFGPCKTGRGVMGLFAYCNPCAAAYMQENQFPSKDARHRQSVKYHISREDLDRMEQEQEGRCAICGGPGGKKGLAIDHCHDTGKVRGLLCSSCNAGIAMLKHDEVLLRNAVSYLRRFA